MALIVLDGENIMRKGTNFGNMIVDIIREKAGADSTVINAEIIKKGILKGDIRMRDFYSAIPAERLLK